MALVMSQVSITGSHVSWPKVCKAWVASTGSYIKVSERQSGCLGDGLGRNCRTSIGAE